MSKQKRYTEQLSLRISPDMEKLIQEVEKREGLSKQEVVRRLVTKGFQRWEQEQRILGNYNMADLEPKKGEIESGTKAAQ